MFWHFYDHLIKWPDNCINLSPMSSVAWHSKTIGYKFLQRPGKFVNWHQALYVQNTHVRLKIFVWLVSYCACRAYTGSPWNYFAQHTPFLPYSYAILAAFWASFFTFSLFIFCCWSNDLLDTLYEGISYSSKPIMILQKQLNWDPCSAYVK